MAKSVGKKRIKSLNKNPLLEKLKAKRSRHLSLHCHSTVRQAVKTSK